MLKKKCSLTLYFTFLFSLLLFCQETKLVVRKTGGSKYVAESYYVLKSNNKVKHGEYIKYFRLTKGEYKKICNGQLSPERYIKIKGNYLNGKKNGEWTEYTGPYSLKTKKYYDSDEKIGIWETVREKGQVIERYDYTADKKLSPIIHLNYSYPVKAREFGIQGTVSVSYKRHSDCSVSDFIILKSLSPECDQLVIDIINESAKLSLKYGVACEEKAETFEFDFVIE